MKTTTFDRLSNQLLFCLLQSQQLINAITLIILLSCLPLTALAENNLLIEHYTPAQPMATPSGKKVILVGGCFDLLHYGHLRFLTQSKALGNYLIVALEADQHSINYKKRQPFHTQQQRAENLIALRAVDKVLLLGTLKGFTDYNQLVQDVHPNIIAVTADDPQLDNKRIQASAISATVAIVTERIGHFSSTNLLKSR